MVISNNEKLLASKTAYLNLSLQERTIGLDEIVADWSSYFGLPVYFWNITQNEISLLNNKKSQAESFQVDSSQSTSEFTRIINTLIEVYNSKTEGIYILENLDSLLRNQSLNPLEFESLKTWLLKIATRFRHERNYYLVLLGTGEEEWKLQDAIPMLKLPFVTVEEVQTLLKRRFSELKLQDYEKTHLVNRAAHILLGLTKPELEWGIRLITNNSDVGDRTVDRYLVKLLEYKIDKLKDLGLEFLPPQEFTEVGGMDILLDHIDRMTDELAAGSIDKIPMQKGWMLVGVPGSGKSYCAKAMAQKMRLPMIYISLDSIRAKGASYLTWILKRVEAAAPNLVYFDEFDKLFPKVKDEQTTAILGVLLTWLQEKKAHSFALATLNRIDALPPEMLRSGRFDIIWYVGFPQPKERLDIFKLHIKRFDERFKSGFDFPIEQWVSLLNKTINFTGAEIESVVTKTIRHKFALKMKELHQLRKQIEQLSNSVKSAIDPNHLQEKELEYLKNFNKTVKGYISCNPELLIDKSESEIMQLLDKIANIEQQIDTIKNKKLEIDYNTLYEFTSKEVSLYKKDPDGVTAIENRAKDVCTPVSSKDTSNLIPKDGTFWSEEPKKPLPKKTPEIDASEIVSQTLKVVSRLAVEQIDPEPATKDPELGLKNSYFG